MDMMFAEFAAALRKDDDQLDDARLLALYAYAGGRHRPDVAYGTVWNVASNIADQQCGRALPLSEKDRARAEAAMLGLPFDESAELPDGDEPEAVVGVAAAIADMVGVEFDEDEAYETAVLGTIEEATRERERWTRASDRLNEWHQEFIAELGGAWGESSA